MTVERTGADSARAEPEAAPAAAPTHVRAGPPSSPAAVLALQRTAGNAAVGRMLAGTSRRTLSRQPAVAPSALKETYFYDRGHFNGRYDGLVERGAGRITLIMRVDMQLAPQFIDQRKGDFSEKTLSYFQYFKTGFKEVVERIWSGAHALRPVVPLDRNYKYETRVRVEFTSTDPHAEISLHPKTIDASTGEAARSCASAAKGATSGSPICRRATTSRRSASWSTRARS
jgi:hypothetical protein